DERKRELELINDYFTAYGLRNHSKFSEALPIFERISPEFERRGNGIFQVFSLLDAATCYSGNRDMLTSIRLINESLSIERNHRWPYHVTLELLQLVNDNASLGQDSQAIKYGEEALKSSAHFRLLQ